MNMSRRRRLAGAALTAAAIAVGFASSASVLAQTAAPPPATAPNNPWTSSPAVNATLAKTAVAGEFAINPPAGFTEVTRDSPDGFGVIYAWTDTKRSDGSQPMLDVIVAHAPKGQEHQFQAADVLANFLANIKVHKLTWSNTTTESGKVGGIEFQRAYYTGVEEVMGNPGDNTHGFVYVAEPSPGNFVIVNGEDAEPYAGTTLPLLEDSALTLRAKNAKNPAGTPAA